MKEVEELVWQMREHHVMVMVPSWCEPKIQEVPVAVNPTRISSMLSGLRRANEETVTLNVLIDTPALTMYAWDGNVGKHHDVAIGLSIDYAKSIRGEALYENGIWSCGCEDPDWRFSDLEPLLYELAVSKVNSLFKVGRGGANDKDGKSG